MSTLNSPTVEVGPAPAIGVPAMAKSLPVGKITRPPVHPGEVLADILEERHISMRAAARAIGMSPTGLEKVLKARGPVTAETALAIEVWFGTDSPEHWLRMQAEYDIWHARRAIADRLAAIAPMERDDAPPAKRKAG